MLLPGEGRDARVSWARLDDGIFEHPKMLALGGGTRGAVRRETWLRILTYTARIGSAVVSPHIADSIPRANRSFLRDCLEIGLLDMEEDGTILVHDWLLYADVPIRDKVAYYLGRFPTATANDVLKGINGGKRELVLAEVKRHHDTHTTTGSQSGSPEPLLAVPGVVLARLLPDPELQDQNLGLTNLETARAPVRQANQPQGGESPADIVREHFEESA